MEENHTSFLIFQRANNKHDEIVGFPGGSEVKVAACNVGDLGSIPCSREWQPTPVFLPGKFYGQKSLADYSPWGRKE